MTMVRCEENDANTFVGSAAHGYSKVSEIINLHSGNGNDFITPQTSLESKQSHEHASSYTERYSPSESRANSSGSDDRQRESNRMASKALRAINERTALDAALRVRKSPSSEILEHYNQQPLHVRSRAEQWELPRTVTRPALFCRISLEVRIEILILYETLTRKLRLPRSWAKETAA